MAAKDNKLILVFKDNNGDDVQFTFGYADTETTAQRVKTLVSTMITNTAIFSVTLVSAVSATIRVVTDTAVDISE